MNNCELKRKRKELISELNDINNQIIEIEEIEEKFMETFNIEEIERWYCKRYECWVSERPQSYSHNCSGMCGMCTNLNKKWVYPKITSYQYLKLLCILSHYNVLSFEDLNEDELKEFILDTLILLADGKSKKQQKLKKEVQELFE